MTKWLGPESSEQAKRIRSVHILHPKSGLDMLWQRLEESYGAPEMVEHALLKKLEDFPRLSNKDSHKLRELGDILLELECAKVEGYLPGLAYLDTARGLKPIVEKLPYSLQERWVTEGFRYKEEYKSCHKACTSNSTATHKLAIRTTFSISSPSRRAF